MALISSGSGSSTSNWGFPSNPYVGQTFNYYGIVYKWNGSSWVKQTTSTSTTSTTKSTTTTAPSTTTTTVYKPSISSAVSPETNSATWLHNAYSNSYYMGDIWYPIYNSSTKESLVKTTSTGTTTYTPPKDYTVLNAYVQDITGYYYGANWTDWVAYGGDWDRLLDDILTLQPDKSGGGGGGGSYGDTSVKFADNLEELFRQVLGRPPTSSERTKYSGSSQYTILQYLTSLPEFTTLSPGYSAIAAPYQYLWYQIIDNDIPLPIEELRTWINNNWTQQQVLNRIRSLPVWDNGREKINLTVVFDDKWDDLTGDSLGSKMTAEDIAKRDWLIKNGGTPAEWEDYILTTPQYKNGSTYLSIKQNVKEVLYDMWGRDVVDALFVENPNYIEDVVWAALGGQTASDTLIADWARQDTEKWLMGPQAAASRENLRDAFIDIMMIAPTPDALDAWLISGMTPYQLIQQLRETPTYKAMYAMKPDWMSEQTWMATGQAYNAVGRWYFGNAGVKQYYTAEELDELRVRQAISPDSIPNGVYRDEDGNYYTYAGASWDFSTEQIRFWIDNGITPEELHSYYVWTEDANANLPNMNFLGEAIGRQYTFDDAYILMSGAAGSGLIRAQLQQAELRRRFDEAFFIYNGRMPTLEDYEWLEANFPNASAYARIMSAEEDAKANFREVDELLMRVFGEHADLEMLKKVALGSADSGVYESKIQLATELDRYRWEFKSYYKVEPTPEDYARFAGYAGPQELAKELEVRELIQARGPSLQKIYNQYWVPLGYESMDDDDVETLVGKYEGWGAIEARMTMAEQHKSQWINAREQAFYYGAAYSPVSYPEFGGVMLPGLRNLRI
jgi:hypothetical protein